MTRNGDGESIGQLKFIYSTDSFRSNSREIMKVWRRYGRCVKSDKTIAKSQRSHREDGKESTYKVVSLEIARPDVKVLSRNVRAGRTEERERGNKVYGGRYNGVGTVCGHRIMAVYSMSSKIAFSNRYLEGIP